MHILFPCLIVLIVLVVGFSMGFVAGSFWTAVARVDDFGRDRSSMMDDAAPYPRAWE